MNISITRALVTLGATGSAFLLAAGVAAAHVTVDAPGAEQGGYAVLTFKVPTESETAGTTQLTVTLPALKSARTEPLPGWKSAVERNDKQEAVSVTWIADPGVSVPPGQFQRFAISVGPLPDDDEVSFDATQTYSDGSVVSWNEPMGADGSEPEHPAPELTLAAASDEGGHSHGASAGHDSESSSAAAADHDDAKDNTARWLGGIALALGTFGVALGLGSAIRNRRA